MIGLWLVFWIAAGTPHVVIEWSAWWVCLIVAVVLDWLRMAATRST